MKKVKELLENYDNVLTVSAEPLEHSQFYRENSFEGDYEALLPTIGAYEQRVDTISPINEMEGDSLIIGLGLNMDLPYLSDRTSEKYVFKGNWWDNITNLDADLLLDQKSYEGAVIVPIDSEVEIWRPEDYTEALYLINQNNP